MDINFQNGFLFAMAILYKKEAEANLINGLIIKSLSESVDTVSELINVTDIATASLSSYTPNNMSEAFVAADSSFVADSVTITLT